LVRNIMKPLRRALEDDVGNPYPAAESAYWAARRWQLFARLKQGQTEPWPRNFEEIWASEIRESDSARVTASDYARKCDPRGRVGYWTDYSSL
ncbi:hypothetical protein ACTGYO_11275, partial [Streptococcus suis]